MCKDVGTESKLLKMFEIPDFIYVHRNENDSILELILKNNEDENIKLNM